MRFHIVVVCYMYLYPYYLLYIVCYAGPSTKDVFKGFDTRLKLKLVL